MMSYKQHEQLTLRISVTDRCQLRCLYCTPPEGMHERSSSGVLSFEEIIRFVRVLNSGLGVSKVRITGGEPLMRRGIIDLITLLSGQGIADLALTTNGQLLAEMASDLKGAGLRRVNVSLDSLDVKTFGVLSGGGQLGRTLRGIEAALGQELMPVKTNTVVLRGYNDCEVTALARFGLERGCRVRFLELMPIGCARSSFEELFVSTAEVRARLEETFTLQPLIYKAGESSRDFLAWDGQGRRGIIGFISPVTARFCGNCTRLRLTSTGRLISCLARGQGPNVRSLLQSDLPGAAEALLMIVETELDKKRDRLVFDTMRPMVAVGG